MGRWPWPVMQGSPRFKISRVKRTLSSKFLRVLLNILRVTLRKVQNHIYMCVLPFFQYSQYTSTSKVHVFSPFCQRSNTNQDKRQNQQLTIVIQRHEICSACHSQYGYFETELWLQITCVAYKLQVINVLTYILA